jgi:hypothetical protein
MSGAGFITASGKEVDMIRYLAVLILPLAVLSTSGSAENRRVEGHRGTQQQQRACRPDVLKHCRGVQDQDDDAIADCLRSHLRQLSPVCRQAIKESGE